MNALEKCDIRLVYYIEYTKSKNFAMVFLTLGFFFKNGLKIREFIFIRFELNLSSQIYILVN